MDEALARVVVDLSGRPWCRYEGPMAFAVLGDGFHPELAREFFHAFAQRGGMALHAAVLYGENTHHQLEALFKALALALRRALRVEGRDVPSTKGTLTR
jgi:imidazoleglycerol-phosphate dehydratase